MLKLGKFALLAMAAIAGLGVLVHTAPWLAWLQHGTAMPPGTERRWLAFVLWVGASLLGRHALQQWQRAREATELASVRRGQAFVARAGAGWFLLAVPLCALFAWAGHAAATRERWGMAVMCLGLLALFLLLGWQLARQVLRPGPMLRMDAQGIDHALYGPIPWREVVGMQLQSVRVRHSTQHTLMLGVRDAPRYLENAPSLTRWLHGRRMRGRRDVAGLPIPLNLLDKDAEVIHQSARALRRRQDAPFLEHWHPRMDAREVEAMLRMQALAGEGERLAEAMRQMPDSPSQEQLAALDARMREHHGRLDAAMPELRVAMETNARRLQRDVRGAWIVMAVILGLLVLSVALRFLR